MSQADAVAFLERVESDEEFAADLESVKQDRDAVRAKVQAAGFDATPDEIREAFVDRYGVELTPKQLDQIAAGSDADTIIGGTIATVGIIGMAAAAAAF
jgi:predicted ribosomally synthesized peptide with nif11-like leader